MSESGVPGGVAIYRRLEKQKIVRVSKVSERCPSDKNIQRWDASVDLGRGSRRKSVKKIPFCKAYQERPYFKNAAVKKEIRSVAALEH